MQADLDLTAVHVGLLAATTMIGILIGAPLRLGDGQMGPQAAVHHRHLLFIAASVLQIFVAQQSF